MIHKEGKTIILITLTALLIMNSVFYVFTFNHPMYFLIVMTISILLLYIIIQFFRNPKRQIQVNERFVLSPADGKIVVIEKITEPEYFNNERIQISIFMSLWNVHVNRFPITGLITYFKYHGGNYLIARNPKSSLENERTTIVIEDVNKREVLFRQIAGIVARRIVFNSKINDSVRQGDDCGFIKFGSRLDIFLPLNSNIHVKIGDHVKAGISTIAEFRT
jgi:phosphatidylserine decarboxylase